MKNFIKEGQEKGRSDAPQTFHIITKSTLTFYTTIPVIGQGYGSQVPAELVVDEFLLEVLAAYECLLQPLDATLKAKKSKYSIVSL